jgi:hypothetical protein
MLRDRGRGSGVLRDRDRGWQAVAAPMVHSGGRTVSRARTVGGNKKLLSVARESVGPEILGHVDIMRDAPLVQASPFSSYGICAYQGCLSYHCKGRPYTRGASCIPSKARRV